MGFKYTYHRFFSVRVKKHSSDLFPGLDSEHDKALTVLSFHPTYVCKTLLNDHNLVFRNTTSGFDVYYRSNENALDPIISPINSKTRFSFGVKVMDSTFFGLYVPSVPNQPQIYLDNLTPGGSISNAAAGNLTSSNQFKEEDTGLIQKQSFSQRTDVTKPNPPTEWIIKEKFTPQNTIKTIPIVTEDDAETVEVRINDPLLSPDDYIDAPGVYVFESNKPGAEETTLYLSDELSGKSMNGVLDIYWNNSQENAPITTGKQYQIIFKLK